MTTIKFLLKDKKLIGTRFGADIMEGGEKNLAVMIPLAKAIGFPTYHYNCISGIKDDAAAALVISFAQAVGAKLGIHLPIWRRLAPDYYEWVVKTYAPVVDFFQLDNESLTTPTPMTNEQYIVLCHEVMMLYPQYKYSWDAGMIPRTYTSAIHTARNVELAKQQPPPDEFRQYAQIVDILKSEGGKVFTKDQTANIELIKNYSAVLFNKHLTESKKQLPNLKSQNVLQFFLENAGENFLTDAVSNYGIAEYLRLVLTNTESFARVFWMQIAGLMSKGVASPEYKSFLRIMPATKFLYVVPLEIKLDGVTGIGTYNGVDSFSMILNNEKNTEYTITANEIKIFGKTISGLIIRNSGFAQSWISTQQSEEVADIATRVKPFSVNYITFKTSQIIGES